MSLKPIARVEKTAGMADLRNKDGSSFRSLLMRLIWLTKTRCDTIREIVHLQTEMVDPRGIHVKQFDAVLKNALANQDTN
eukprot:65024-Pyramimonas_sp.AAC.1